MTRTPAPWCAMVDVEVMRLLRLGVTVTSWFCYLRGTDEQGREMPMMDPMAERL